MVYYKQSTSLLINLSMQREHVFVIIKGHCPVRETGTSLYHSKRVLVCVKAKGTLSVIIKGTLARQGKRITGCTLGGRPGGY